MNCSSGIKRLLLALGLVAAGSACSTTITKNKAGSACKSNTDCETGNVCLNNLCTMKLDCLKEENARNIQCNPSLSCAQDGDCQAGFFCDDSKCVQGERPPCGVDDDCTNEAAPHCLTFADGAANKCVACITTDQCKGAGEVCKPDNTCAVPAVGSCTSSSQCTIDPKRVCDRSSGDCVECLRNTDCKGANKVCKSKVCQTVSTADCTQDGCPNPQQPICDNTQGGTKLCLSCGDAAAKNLSCPPGQQCENATGRCIPTITPPAGCATNNDCPAPPAATTAGATEWCDLTAQPAPACKPCRLDQDCGNARMCITDAGSATKVCVAAATQCIVANNTNDCAAADDACVSGACTKECTATAQCKSGRGCQLTPATGKGVCAVPATCTTAADCTTGGIYNGFACKGAAQKTCQDCASNGECTVVGQTICDSTSKRCRPPTEPPGKLLGSDCVNNGECSSGLCNEFVGSAGNLKLCTSVCARTATISAAANDCPTAPPTGVGAPVGLNADRGFTCLNKSLVATELDGVGLCVHADHLAALSANAALSIPGAFVQPAGGAPAGDNPLLCQAGYTVPLPDASAEVCGQGCGANGDCDPSLISDDVYTCNEELVSVDGIYLSSGRRTCFARDVGADDETATFAPGEACFNAPMCNEGFCGGTCVSFRVPAVAPSNTSCTTSADCSGTDECDEAEGVCYKSTFKTEPEYCSLHADCAAGMKCLGGLCQQCNISSDCGTGAFCSGGLCYTESARHATSQYCQDDFQCDANSFCGGRCLHHCNSQADCSTGSVCGYWPGQAAEQGFDGQAWGRVCRARLASIGRSCTSSTQCVLSTCDTGKCCAGTVCNTASLKARGAACGADAECLSEVCEFGRCTDYCGRAGAGICTGAAEKCTLVDRGVVPGGATLKMPVCVVF